MESVPDIRQQRPSICSSTITSLFEKEEYKRLNEILSSPQQLAFFQTYLQKICAHENLLFIEALSELKHETSLKEIEAIVHRIWDTFFTANSPLQLNINNAKEIQRRIESYKWGILTRKDALNIFKEAEKEVKIFLNEKIIEFDKLYNVDTLTKSTNAAIFSYQKKVVIIGGGFTGFTVASILDPMPRFHVTLIDTKDSFEYTPGIIKLLVRPEEISSSLRVRHDQYVKNGRVIIGYADQIIKDAKYVKVNDHQIPFDYLVIATGSLYYSKLKSFDTSSLYRVSDLTNEHLLLKKAKSVLIIGGGLVGCELANEIATHNYQAPYDFKKKITLIDSHSSLVPRGSIKQQENALRYFKSLNVQVILNEKIIDFDSNETNSYLGASGTRYSNYDKVFLATGTKPCSHILRGEGDAGFESCVDHWGYLRVKPTLQLDHYKYTHIFVGGDVSNVIEEKTGYAATLAGVTIARNICRIEKGKPPIDQGTKGTLSAPLKALHGIDSKGGVGRQKLNFFQKSFAFLNPTWAALKFFDEKEFMAAVQGNATGIMSSLAIGKKPKILGLPHSYYQQRKKSNTTITTTTTTTTYDNNNNNCKTDSHSILSFNATHPTRHTSTRSCYNNKTSTVLTPSLHSRTSSRTTDDLHVSPTNLSGSEILSVHKLEVRHHPHQRKQSDDLPSPAEALSSTSIEQNGDDDFMLNLGLKPQPAVRTHYSNPNPASER